jgi:DNA-directed RNA polymerase specialized sigma24 family protein
LATSLDPLDDRKWSAILRRVIAALRRRFPAGPDPLAAEDAALSAVRTLLRQLQDVQQPPPPPDELLAWLVLVACRKHADLYRQADLERRHAESVGHHAATLRGPPSEDDGERLLARLPQELDALYERATPEERIVLDGQRQGQSQVEIADRIAREVPARKGRCSQPTVSRLWKDLCTRLKQRLSETEEGP